MLKAFIFFPWAMMVGFAWHYIRVYRHLVVDFGTPSGLAFLGVALFVLLVEFIRSADIGPIYFLLDLFFALVTVGYAAYTLTLIDQQHAWNAGPDLIIFGILFADALISPFNSFSTALRNVVHSSY